MTIVSSNRRALAQEAEDFFAANPEIDAIDIIFTNMCGVPRGKRLRQHEVKAVYQSGRFLPGSVLVVTADHGMVDCAADDAVPVDVDARLTAGVAAVVGDPRARHVYVRPGAVDDVRAAWGAVLGDRVRLLRREEVVESGLMGVVDPFVAERIGDLMAVSRGTTKLTTRADARVSALIGQHGGLTADEVDVPALRYRAE